jgi:hypothetical protein
MSNTPAATAVTIDLTSDTTAAASVAALDMASRVRLYAALRDVDSTEAARTILSTIRDVLAREAPGQVAIGVVFDTMEYDNGHFLTDTGLVLFADGTTEQITFDSLDSDVFTDEYGCVGKDFVLTVDLRRGELDTDDNFHASVHERFGLPDPPKETIEVWTDEDGMWHAKITFPVPSHSADDVLDRNARLYEWAWLTVQEAANEPGAAAVIGQLTFDTPTVKVNEAREVQWVTFSQTPPATPHATP